MARSYAVKALMRGMLGFLPVPLSHGQISINSYIFIYILLLILSRKSGEYKQYCQVNGLVENLKYIETSV